jgi:AcrR family transcriptional regulator
MSRQVRDSTGKARRRKVPRPARERQMLDMATRVFGARGYHAASMDEIARACGVTKPMLYAYFGSKDGLFLATVDRTGKALVSAVDQLLGEPDAVQRLRHGVDVILEFIRADRHSWEVLYAEGLGQGPIAKRVSQYRERIVQAAAITLVDAVPGSSMAQAEPYAVGLIGAGEAVARWWLDQPGLPFARMNVMARHIVEGVLAAYRAEVAPRAPRAARRTDEPLTT